MKKIIPIIVIVAAIMFGLIFTKNTLASAAISAGVNAVTGLGMKMRSVDVGIVKTLINIKGLKIYNPRGFSDRVMADIPELYIDYDLGALFKGNVHLEKMKLNLKEFVVVKNQKGELNLDSVKVVKSKKDGAAAKAGRKKEGLPEVKIDILEIKIDKVIYKDYSKGMPPIIKEFSVNINERYENITNLHTLASLVMFKALAHTRIAGLADFNIGLLREGLDSILYTATKKIIVEGVGGAAKGVIKSLEGIFKQK